MYFIIIICSKNKVKISFNTFEREKMLFTLIRAKIWIECSSSKRQIDCDHNTNCLILSIFTFAEEK